MEEITNCDGCGRPLETANAECAFCVADLAKKPFSSVVLDRKIGAGETLLCFTYPFWGTVLFVALSCLSKGGAFIYIGMFCGFLSAYPIFLTKNIDFILKVIISLFYYFVGTFIVFFVGWASVCQFCPSCN